MRVIAGSARGLRLEYPKGAGIRPTTDRVRESLFSSIGDDIIDCRFCDLYAGAGSVGIEALSRGAASATFVERDPRCIAVLERNLQTTHLAGTATVRRGRLPECLKEIWQNSGPFDIVFADPPYRAALDPLLSAVADAIGGADAVFLLQSDSRVEPEPGPLRVLRRRTYGETALTWYHA